MQKNIDLWNNKLIPLVRANCWIKKALIDDVKSRNTLEKSFTSISTFANSIYEAACLIRDSRGSAGALESVCKIILKRQAEVQGCMKELEAFKGSAIIELEGYLDKILDIVAPNAAEFAKAESGCESEITRLNLEAQKLLSQLAEARDVADRYNNLCHAQEVVVNGAQEAMNRTKERSQQLHSMIKDSETEINNIPDTISKTSSHTSGIWFWRHSWTSTTQVQNPDKKAQVDYYTGLINARTMRLKEQESDAQTITNKQNELLAKYKSDFQSATKKFEDQKTLITPQLKRITNTIEAQLKRIESIRESANKVETQVGIKGSAVLQCLAAIRTFGERKHEHATIYQPLISILKEVLSLTDISVAVFQRKPLNQLEVYAAGKSLLKHVGFFQATTARLREINNSSEERIKAIKDK